MTYLKALFPNMVTLELRAPTYELMGNTIQSKSDQNPLYGLQGLAIWLSSVLLSQVVSSPHLLFISQFLKHAGFFPF